MKRSIHLHGRLKRVAPGGPFSFHVRSISEVVRALTANFPKFAAELAKGQYKIILGPKSSGEPITEDRLQLYLPDGPVHIIPTTAGAKGRGVGKIVLGVALIGLGVAGAAIAGAGAGGLMAGMGMSAVGPVSWGAVGLFGASLAFAGVSQQLTAVPPMPSAAGLEPADQRNSFLLGSPTQTTAQGQPVPIVGGRMRVGSLVASAGISVEKLPV